MVPGIVLAAGASSRMGTSKAMLRCGAGDDTFVVRLIQTFRAGGAAGLFVVGREGDDVLRAEIERLGPFAVYTINRTAERGQLSSLIAGLNAADRPGVRAVIVSPVDVPLIAVGTVARLITTFEATSAPIVRAVYRGAHGHPVIFARSVFDEVRHADPARGAKTVLRARADDIVDVEVDDAAVLVDIDAPEDYERVFGRRP